MATEGDYPVFRTTLVIVDFELEHRLATLARPIEIQLADE